MPRTRALVLCAGLGLRLRPLTSELPKPLLPAAGWPVVSYTLAQLERAGCEAAVLNLHHHGEAIRQTLGREFGRMPLHYSPEEALLGTGGALVQTKEFFRDVEFLFVINADSLCRWPLVQLLRHHQKSAAQATLLLASRPDPSPFGGGVGIDRSGRVVELRGRSPGGLEAVVKRHVFAGAQVFSRQLIERLPTSGPNDLVGDLHLPLLLAGQLLQSVTTPRSWHDLGTPSRYLEAARDWARGRYPRRVLRPSWVAPGARVERGVRLRNCALERGAVAGEKSQLVNVLVMPGGRVGRESRLCDVIVGPGVDLPPRSQVEGHMITPLALGRSPSGRDSVLGRLVYSPLD